MCSRVYVCMYVCVYVCMCVCESVRMDGCVYICQPLSIFWALATSEPRMCLCVCVYVCMCVCLMICIYVCIYVSMCIHMPTNEHFLGSRHVSSRNLSDAKHESVLHVKRDPFYIKRDLSRIKRVLLRIKRDLLAHQLRIYRHQRVSWTNQRTCSWRGPSYVYTRGIHTCIRETYIQIRVSLANQWACFFFSLALILNKLYSRPSYVHT
jgi:hypothetical protein